MATVSMLNITQTPLHPEPLPLYSRHDPDAISIHSAAPSYVSEVPTYTSRRPSIPHRPSLLPPLLDDPSRDQPRTGLPPARYAPGFQSRAHGSLSDINMNNFNVGSWSSTRSSQNSRQLHAVARRRANQAANTTAILNSLSAVPPPMTSSPTSASRGSSTSPNASSSSLLPSATTYPVSVGNSSDPLNPLEDPYLVGEEAAARARAARVYREMCIRGEETARYESRSWDFMLSQMADWDERQASWTNFRQKIGRPKLLGKRLRLGGLRG